MKSTCRGLQNIFLFKQEASTTADVLEVSENPAVTLGTTATQEGYCSTGGCAEAERSSPLCLANNGCACEHPTSEPQLQEKLKQLQLSKSPAPKASMTPTDPSCLLTPPTTPLNFDSGSPESPQGTGKGLQDPRRNGMNGTKGSTPEGTEYWHCFAVGVQDWGRRVFAAILHGPACTQDSCGDLSVLGQGSWEQMKHLTQLLPWQRTNPGAF